MKTSNVKAPEIAVDDAMPGRGHDIMFRPPRYKLKKGSRGNDQGPGPRSTHMAQASSGPGQAQHPGLPLITSISIC